MSPISALKSFGAGFCTVLSSGSSSAMDVTSISSNFDSVAFVLSARDLVRGIGPRFLALELLAARPFLVFTMVKRVCFGLPFYVRVSSVCYVEIISF